MTRTSLTGNRRGFTLLELLVTLVIMTLLTGVAAVSLAPALAEAKLRTGTRTVLAALRYARSYAVSHQTEAVVHLDADGGVAVFVPDTETEDEDAWRPLTTQAGRRRLLPDGVLVTAVEDAQTETERDPAVTFTALGQGEAVRITLQDSGERTRVILVDALTGSCTVEEGQ